MAEEKHRILLDEFEEDTYETEKEIPRKKTVPKKENPKPQNQIIPKRKKRHKVRSNP